MVTRLFDNDGNVFFTIYLSDKGVSGPNCVINSGSTPGTFEPYIDVFSQDGLHCEIEETGHEGSVYHYNLNITAD